ncbi:response regulator transcription factor [Ilyomonas limi]|nr:helix-turn-helix transcriptional regulator [Ilyomonas limi]
MPFENFPYSFYNIALHTYKPKTALKSGNTQTEKWKAWIPLLEQVSLQSCVQVLLWDVAANKFIYQVDKRNIIGHHAGLYLAHDGAAFCVSNFHPHFFTAIRQCRTTGGEYLLQIQQDACNAILNVDFLYRRSTGSYMHCLLQGKCIAADEDGDPVLILYYQRDITHLKKEKTLNLVITTPTRMQWWNYDFNGNYLERVQPLSKQERKILTCLADGQSSACIAKKLFISLHTVNTHRRHLLHKTNCTDTTGMITYAKLVGLL